MSSNQTVNPVPTASSAAETRSWLWMVIKIFALVIFFLTSLIFLTPVALFLIGITLLILAKRNEMQRRLNCWTLAIALERQIPISQTLLCLALESKPWMRSHLRKLFRNIQSGMRFEDAICGTPQVIPRFALPLFRIGCLSGRPSRAMQIISSQEDTENYKIAQTLLGRLFYLTLCFIVMVMIAWFIILKIVPALYKINADFGMVQGPLFLPWLRYFCSFPFGGLLNIFLSGVLLVLIGCCFYMLLRLMGVVTFDLPLTGRIMRRTHRARIHEALSLAAECEMPIEEAIRELAYFYPTTSIRNRLVNVYQQMENGCNWKPALRNADLLTKTEHAVVESAEATGDLAWTFCLLAAKSRRRMLYWTQWVQQLLFVGIVIVFAGLVFMAAMMMFEFLVRLIHCLSLP